jgi:hypothetical protein
LADHDSPGYTPDEAPSLSKELKADLDELDVLKGQLDVAAVWE